MAQTCVVTESQEAALVVDRLLAQGQVNTSASKSCIRIASEGS